MKPDEAVARPLRRLIVSFHDLHPGSQEACARVLDWLAKLGVDRVSLLVVPRWHESAPCTDDPDFMAWLRAQADAGHDICLHGWTHRADQVTGGPLSRGIGRIYTQSEGEFFQLNRAEALRRIRLGLDLLAGEARLPVFGFTPPAWLLSGDARAAVVAAGLHYTTTWSTVELLRRNEVVSAPTLVYSCRNAWRRLASRGWVRIWHRRHRQAPVLRIAIHPGDLADIRVEASLHRLVAAAMSNGRVATTYRDLLPADAIPVSAPTSAVA